MYLLWQLPDNMKQSQADLYLETYQVLDLEMSRLREIQRWQASAAAKVLAFSNLNLHTLFVILDLNFHRGMDVFVQLAADMQRFSRPERRINGPTVTHLWYAITFPKHFLSLVLMCVNMGPTNLFMLQVHVEVT